jgi:integrase/recombinase XerC
MFDLGLRRGEVVGLDVEDVDHAGQRLWVLGKGRAQKEVRTIPAQTLEAIDRWLTLRGAIAREAEPALFVNTARFKPGRRLTGHGLYRVIRSLGDLAGVRARPHGLRHASITGRLSIRPTATYGLRKPTHAMPIHRPRCGMTTIV